MEEGKKRILLISLSTVVMVLFVYFEYFSQPTSEMHGFVNPSQLDTTPSKQNIYEENRKKERKFQQANG